MAKGKNKDFINCLKALMLFEKIKRQEKYGNFENYDFKLERIKQEMWIQKMKQEMEERTRQKEMEEFAKSIKENIELINNLRY